MLSVLVPVGPADEPIALRLDSQLARLPSDVQVVYASSAERPPELHARALWTDSGGGGRAQALNAAAEHAQGKYLWFVHADTILDPAAYPALLASLQNKPEALHYFGLAFADGGSLMRINEFGVALRCRWFSAPFGDQAICVPRSLHSRIGGFDPEAPYGEDHLYVRAARRTGAECIAVPAVVRTSARKYQRGGLRVACPPPPTWIRQALADRADR